MRTYRYAWAGGGREAARGWLPAAAAASLAALRPKMEEPAKLARRYGAATAADAHPFGFPFPPYDVQLQLMRELYRCLDGIELRGRKLCEEGDGVVARSKVGGGHIAQPRESVWLRWCRWGR